MQGVSNHIGPALTNEHLTLVLMTQEQPVVLRRALEFHEDFPGKILVVDSSAQPATAVAEYFPTVAYHHVPGLSSLPQHEHRAYAVCQVNTPYMVFADDDDFLVVEGVRQCLTFLHDNPEYGFCHGYDLMYRANGAQVSYCYRHRKGLEDYADDDPDLRTLAHAKHFVPVGGAVVRTELAVSWYAQCSAIDQTYQSIGYAMFLLHEAKGRVLPVAYSVRALSFPELEPEVRLQHSLSDDAPQSRQKREIFLSTLTTYPGMIGREHVMREALRFTGNCLHAQDSLTLREIFSGTLSWTEGARHRFQPVQQVEMPFYNQAFFSMLEGMEFLLQALPGGAGDGQALEATLLKQRELVRDRQSQDPEQQYQRLQEGFALYPFDASLGRRLLVELRQRGDVQSALHLHAWVERVEHAQRSGGASVFEDSLSGLLYQRLHAFKPCSSTLVALEDNFSANGGGPLIGLILLSLDGDVSKLQLTLDSVLESVYKRYQIVVLTTSSPPVATRETDRLHFVRVQAVDWQHQLNRLAERANWSWLLVAEMGSCFTPYGLLKVAAELMSADSCRAVYCDELQLLASGTLTSLFRPSFNLDLLLSSPRTMAQHWLVRRETFLAHGGYSARYPQASALDFILRMIEADGMSGIGHVDEILLVSEHDSGESNLDELNALRRHLTARGYERGTVLQTAPRCYHLRYGHAQHPLVSILIPTRDQLAMVARCVESILEHTRYTNFEVILIDNQSESEEALHWLAGIESMADAKIRVLRYPYPFNFSAMNNYAAREACGEYLVLLNNDTEITDGNWLDELLNHAQRPEVGIVGARLHYPDGTLQHAGVVLGLRGPAEHPWLRRDPHAPSYMGRSQLDQNFSAVTAACLMIRASIYEQMGGLDEQAFAVSYNDVDLCLRVGEAGYLTVWAQRAVVTHEGSVSQVSVDPLSQSAKRMRFVREQGAFYKRWMPSLINDPAYNRNLSLCGNGFEVDDKLFGDRELRSLPLVVALAGPGQTASVSECWEGLGERASVLVMRYGVQVPELLRTAPDVLVVPGALCQLDPLALQLFHSYCPGVTVLDLGELSNHGWTHGETIPEYIVEALSLVDRVLVTNSAAAQALMGLHADIRLVPTLLGAEAVMTKGQWIVEGEGLLSCLP